jgi:formamidopyrimidine-DNA glycosylase
MPELPEVETTRRGIDSRVTGRILQRMVLRGTRLRWPVPESVRQAEGSPVISTRRRGKYLLIDFECGTQIVHLGMSGSLRWLDTPAEPRPHEHIDWVFAHGVLRLHDPRRFGAVLWHARDAGPLERHPLLAKLGCEPLEPGFSADVLKRGFAERRVAIKQALLAGDVVVGVGNIYASECLFRAGIRPGTAAGRLSRPRLERLVDAIRAVLTEAIDAGGSSLRDFSGIDGELGHFQTRSDVYDREGQPCRVCSTPIRRRVQGQRATYWCPSCQKP